MVGPKYKKYSERNKLNKSIFSTLKSYVPIKHQTNNSQVRNEFDSNINSNMFAIKSFILSDSNKNKTPYKQKLLEKSNKVPDVLSSRKKNNKSMEMKKTRLKHPNEMNLSSMKKDCIIIKVRRRKVFDDN